MQRTRPIPDGSRTITIHDTTLRELQPADPNVSEGIEDGGGDVQNRARQPVLVLSLQGGGNDVRRKRKPGRRVVWKEDVIDNEGCGKKKSKICCIYHKPRRFDESSDESSGESDCEGHNHAHGPPGSADSGAAAGPSSSASATSSATTTATVVSHRHSELNAYETQPYPAPSH